MLLGHFGREKKRKSSFRTFWTPKYEIEDENTCPLLFSARSKLFQGITAIGCIIHQDSFNVAQFTLAEGELSEINRNIMYNCRQDLLTAPTTLGSKDLSTTEAEEP